MVHKAKLAVHKARGVLWVLRHYLRLTMKMLAHRKIPVSLKIWSVDIQRQCLFYSELQSVPAPLVYTRLQFFVSLQFG
jgi:hypothetical protein